MISNHEEPPSYPALLMPMVVLPSSMTVPKVSTLTKEEAVISLYNIPKGLIKK